MESELAALTQTHRGLTGFQPKTTHCLFTWHAPRPALCPQGMVSRKPSPGEPRRQEAGPQTRGASAPSTGGRGPDLPILGGGCRLPPDPSPGPPPLLPSVSGPGTPHPQADTLSHANSWRQVILLPLQELGHSSVGAAGLSFPRVLGPVGKQQSPPPGPPWRSSPPPPPLLLAGVCTLGFGVSPGDMGLAGAATAPGCGTHIARGRPCTLRAGEREAIGGPARAGVRRRGPGTPHRPHGAVMGRGP